MAENPEIHPGTLGTGAPEATGPVWHGASCFGGGRSENEEEFPDVDSDGETCHVKCSFAVSSFGASE